MTHYDPDWIRTYFDDYGVREWDRWDESSVERVKFHVHLHYLRQHVRTGDRTLEIGAGAGRFTREIARITDRIVVADISPGQLRLNRENAVRLDFATAVESWVECDMCDLRSHFTDGSFDVVVCTGGPLSYVFERRDDALSELHRVTRDGGTLLLSVISLWGSVHQYLPGVLDVDPDANRTIVATGDLSPETIGPGRHYTHMYRADELRQALENGGWIIDGMSASNCISANWSDLLDEISENSPTWSELIAMEIEASCQPGCLDLGTHLIAVCRKPGRSESAAGNRPPS